MKKEALIIKIFRKFRPLFLNEILEKNLFKILEKSVSNRLLDVMVPPYYLHKKDAFRLVKRNGINLKLNLKHYNDHQTFWFYKKDVLLNNIVNFIEPSSIVFDVGVNIGYYLLNFAKKAEKGFVYGFEPNPEVFAYVENNCSLNSFQNIKLNNFGLGHCENNFKMVQINENLGMNKITTAEDATNSFLIEVKRLDTYLSKQTISQMDVVKIDVEGFEFNVLQGAEKSIIKWKPLLFIEIDEANLQLNNASFKIIELWLLSKGYSIWNAFTVKRLVKEDINNHFDILAVPLEKINKYSNILN